MSRLLTYGVMQQKRKISLGFEVYVAPTGFDPDAQPVNIYSVFKDYYNTNNDAKYIYSVTDATASTVLSEGTSYHYGYTSGGTDYVVDVASGTITWVAGSTKRWVIVNNTTTSAIVAKPPTGSEWLYCGGLINEVFTRAITTIKYIHIHDLSTITGYTIINHDGSTGLSGNLNISDTATSFTIAVFRNCSSLTGTLTIPGNITSIGEQAFAGCKFTSLVLNSGLITIGLKSFSNITTFTGTLTIPNTVTSIANEAFSGNTGFTALNLGTSVQTIGVKSFYNCTGFDGTLTFPASLTTIGELAFYSCNGFDGTLTISSGITSIAEGAFAYCTFNALDVSSNAGYHSHDGVLYQESTHTAIHGLKGETGTLTIESDTLIIGKYCFAASVRSGNLTIPNSVKSISDYAFDNRGGNGFSDGTLTLGTSVITIGISAFAFISHYMADQTLTIPDSVTTLNTSAFNHYSIGNFAYTHFTSLVIGTGVITIGSQSFREAIKSGSITINSAILTTIGSYAFQHCGATGTMNIPASVTTIDTTETFTRNAFTAFTSSSTNYPASDNVLYDVKTSGQVKACFGAAGYSGTLTLRSDTTSILGGSFYNSSGRTGTLTIPSTVTSIATLAFFGCSGFTRCDSYPSTAPTIAGTPFGNYAIPLHVPTGGGTGYGVAPWTTTAIFSSKTADL